MNKTTFRILFIATKYYGGFYAQHVFIYKDFSLFGKMHCTANLTEI